MSFYWDPGPGEKVEFLRLFEIEEFKKLEIPNKFKTAFIERDREINRSLENRDYPSTIRLIDGMAGTYSEVVPPVVPDTDRLLSDRLELLLWMELEHFGVIFRRVMNVKVSPVIYAKILALSSRWLTDNNVSHEKRAVQEMGAHGLETYEAIVLLPDTDTVLGRLSNSLNNHPTNPVALNFTPSYTCAAGWAAKMTESAIHVSRDAILELQIDSDTGHELIHWNYQTQLTQGTLTDFHGDVVRSHKRPFPPSVGDYQDGFSFDELSAYGYNMARARAAFESQKDPFHRRGKIFRAMADAKSGSQISQGIRDVLTDALSTLNLLNTHTLTPSNVTSNRTGILDARPSKSLGVGIDGDHEIGFQLTDFRKPGTHHLRIKLISNGWIFGVPSFEKQLLFRARRINA